MKLPTPAACATSSPMFARASPSSKLSPRWVSLSATLTLSPSAAMRSRISLYASTTMRVSASSFDPLPEQRRVGLEAAVVEPPQHDDRVVERLPRDEPGRAEAHPVPPHASLQPRAVRGREDRLSQGRLDASEGRHLGSGLYATATNRPVPNGRAPNTGVSPGGRHPSCRKCDELSTGLLVQPSVSGSGVRHLPPPPCRAADSASRRRGQPVRNTAMDE